MVRLQKQMAAGLGSKTVKPTKTNRQMKKMAAPNTGCASPYDQPCADNEPTNKK